MQFEEIMSYCEPNNGDVYKEMLAAYDAKSLVPFVGAGLTAFAYTKTWADALKGLAENLNARDNRDKIEQAMQKDYLEAAQLLENLRGRNNLARDMAKFFAKEKLLSKNRSGEAITLLPVLFPDLLVTTNFDEGLELACQDNGERDIPLLHPGHGELLNQFRQLGGRCVLKLHGTITGNYVEYDKIVFTQEQYDRHYGADSPLPDELTGIFNGKCLLFLGCSLDVDRTMELMRQVTQPGIQHFAIISSAENEMDEKIAALSDQRNVRAIVYPKGKHEAVRVILEKLLEETNPSAYRALRKAAGALQTTESRFSYKSGRVGLYGRDGDMAQLLRFVTEDADKVFRWWAITGPGGAGKSRLAFELEKNLPAGWMCRWLTREDYDNLPDLAAKYTGNTLFVADYVQEHAEKLGRWMASLASARRSCLVRALLVERDAEEKGFSWVKQIKDGFRTESAYEANLFAPFLALQPLKDVDLLQIMEEFAEGKLPGEKAQELLQRLKEIDPKLHRPLYALFLTDAYLENKHPERWSQKDILQYVTDREITHLSESIQEALPSDKGAVRKICLNLYRAATVLQDAQVSELKALFSADWHKLTQKTDDFESPEAFLQQVGLARGKVLPALRPDLAGEYLVLRWAEEMLSEGEADRVLQFLSAVWTQPEKAFVFFDRLFRDYAYLLDGKPDLWEALLPDGLQLQGESAFWRAALWVEVTAFCGQVSVQYKVVAKLEMMEKEYKSPIIAGWLAMGLVNLSKELDEMGRTDIVIRLEELLKKYPTVLVVEPLARALGNLSAKQNKVGRADSVIKLERLLEKYPSSVIAERLAVGLFNLSIEQDEKQHRNTIRQLEQLFKEYPMPEIAEILARGLFNLSFKQGAVQRRVTIANLERLSQKYPLPKVIMCFVAGIVNLSSEVDETECVDIVDCLEGLLKAHRTLVFAEQLAMGLGNLSLKQDVPDAEKTVERIQKLTEQYPESDGIRKIYQIAKDYLNKRKE